MGSGTFGHWHLQQGNAAFDAGAGDEGGFSVLSLAVQELFEESEGQNL